MKYFTLIAVAFAAGAAAQSQCDSFAAKIPACAQSCVREGNAGAGCTEGDYKCGCEKATQIQTAVAPCVIKACPAEQLQSIQSTAAALCQCALGASGGGSSGGDSGSSSADSGSSYPTATGGASYPTSTASLPSAPDSGNSTAPPISTGLGNTVQPMMAAALFGAVAAAML